MTGAEVLQTLIRGRNRTLSARFEVLAVVELVLATGALTVIDEPGLAGIFLVYVCYPTGTFLGLVQAYLNDGYLVSLFLAVGPVAGFVLVDALRAFSILSSLPTRDAPWFVFDSVLVLFAVIAGTAASVVGMVLRRVVDGVRGLRRGRAKNTR